MTGVSLYHKSRGIRTRTPLTAQGQQFLPHATALLEQCDKLTHLFAGGDKQQEVHVVASQYLIAYSLIDIVRRFQKQSPKVRVRLSARTEREIEKTLLTRPDISLGVAAPYEHSTDLDYLHCFSMDWSVITPTRHRLAKRASVKLEDLGQDSFILYEQGSTGRQHVMEAFHKAEYEPQIAMESTNTDLIVRMVEAGLGLSIVPLLKSGAVTRGRRVKELKLETPIRAIESGVLVRKGEPLPEAAQALMEFIRSELTE
jgi:DNA-binding transcriptional LysR family regulator